MIISEVINMLQEVKEKHGDIEVTMTGCLSPDVENPWLENGPYETTVDSHCVYDPSLSFNKRRVRLYS